MSGGGDWEKQEIHVLKTLERHDEAIEKQDEINHTQSKFNHEIDKRVASILERIGWAGAGIVLFWSVASEFLKNIDWGKLFR